MNNPKSTILNRVLEFALLLLIPIFFLLLDVYWISSLPRWGISYGPTKITIFIFIIISGGFLLLTLLVNLLSKGRFLSFRGSVITLLIGNLLITGLAIYGFCVEPFRLSQSHIELRVPGLNRPVRIVQLSDLHIEYTTRREQALLKMMASLSPDLIVMTGDYPSQAYANDLQTIADLQSMVSQFHAPFGVYAVNGNAESPKYMGYLLKNTGVRLLDNEVVKDSALSDRVAIVGLSYFDQSYDEMVLKRLMSRVQKDDFSILLYHKPDLAYAARDQNVSLYLTGHTHGGQVRLPLFGALYTNSKYGKTFEMGEYTLDQMTMYVNRGLGFQGGIAPRVRFLAPPEVVVIDLLPRD